MKRLGIDIGSISLGVVILEDGVLRETFYEEHKGNFAKLLEPLLAQPKFQNSDTVGVTGSFEGRDARLIDNSLAVIEGAHHLLPECRNIFVVGGQSYSLIFFGPDGRYQEHSVNPPCAAGTGSFLEQQAQRLGLSASRLSDLAQTFQGQVPTIATRCAVFAKTDIIHSMQEGHSLPAVCAGLCDGLARNVAETLVKGRTLQGPVGFVGGAALNGRLASALQAAVAHPVVVPPGAELAGAVGAALLAQGPAYDIRPLISRSLPQRQVRPPLLSALQDYPDWSAYRMTHDGDVELFREKDAVAAGEGVYLGIDIGSTSTKALAMTPDKKILLGLYTATRGEPIAAVQRLLASWHKAFDGQAPKILGACTTGSGRKMIRAVFSADKEVNEISAHAEAARFINPATDTIIEIGGQDSKFTLLKNGDVVHSTMNYVCAAGTGSFIEEQAKRLGVGLQEFANLALGTAAPYTSDRCTVYMDKDLAALMAEGWSKGALAAAVLNSVRDNYFAKIVGHAPIGEHVVFQGATARNRALVAAFESRLGKPIHVSAYCHLAGALGAALLAQREQPQDSGFSAPDKDSRVQTEICRTCSNRCLLTVVERGEARAGFGMKCGKEYSSRKAALVEPSTAEKRFRSRIAQILKDMRANPPRRQARLGIPAVLYNMEFAPLWMRLLSGLGFGVVYGEPTRRTLAAGRRLVNSDFCAPMILAHGCVEELLKRPVDFIFSPAVVNDHDATVPSKPFRRKTADSYFCYHSQYLPTILDKLTTMSLGRRLISPLVFFNDRSPEKIADDIHQALQAVDPSLTSQEVTEAWLSAWRAFEQDRASWSRTFDALKDQSRLQIALLGRPYVALEAALNLGLPRRFEELGAQVFWQDEFDLQDPELGGDLHDRMHWHYGRTILRMAQKIADTDGLFAVFLSSFRCSPDSFLINCVKDIMTRRGKPFLVLQLDELSSDVGYATRIEAAMRSFELAQSRPAAAAPAAPPRSLSDDKPAPGDTILVCDIDRVISGLWADCFRSSGFRAELLKADEAALATGYRHASGAECMPLVAIAGSAINTVRSQHLTPQNVFLYLPTVCLACNFPQFPIFCRQAFDAAGLGSIKIGLINWLMASDHVPARLSARLVHVSIAGSILHKMYHRTRPHEARSGATEEALAWGQQELSRAILSRKNIKDPLRATAERFKMIERVTGIRKPRIALIGDFFVKYNEQVNQKLQELVFDLGGELIIPSTTEYSLHFLDADARLYGENSRTYELLRKTEAELEDCARDVLGDQVEPDFTECAAELAKYGIKHNIPGETSINVGRVLWYLRRGLVDAVLHINPIFCCPGVTTSSIGRKIQEDFSVPVIDIFYDGTGNPNRLLIPHLHYLRERLNSRPQAG